MSDSKLTVHSGTAKWYILMPMYGERSNDNKNNFFCAMKSEVTKEDGAGNTIKFRILLSVLSYSFILQARIWEDLEAQGW